ncbi:hypothetical protein BC829DRAFT_391263 [Chytridium lagenaria]|nr:hypothetical protein BC829DRAFT_391263 [Chytridium lagenaria]
MAGAVSFEVALPEKALGEGKGVPLAGLGEGRTGFLVSAVALGRIPGTGPEALVSSKSSGSMTTDEQQRRPVFESSSSKAEMMPEMTPEMTDSRSVSMVIPGAGSVSTLVTFQGFGRPRESKTEESWRHWAWMVGLAKGFTGRGKADMALDVL